MKRHKNRVRLYCSAIQPMSAYKLFHKLFLPIYSILIKLQFDNHPHQLENKFQNK